MDYVIAHEDGVLTVDTGYLRPGLAAVHLIVEDGRAAVVDTGVNASVPRVLEALAASHVAPQGVEYVLLTHVHLDHAGGTGHLMAALPNARLVVHPRGARHMIDPSRLWQAAAAVYGEAEAYAMYGHLVPVPPERVIAVDDGQVFFLGSRALTVWHTPGHARHHVAIHDSVAQAVFTGDTFGVSYRELDVAGRASVIPTTTPTEFEPEALHASIDRILAARPSAAYLTHFGRVRELERLATDLHRLIDAYVEVARSARGEGVARHLEILAGLHALMHEEAERQGWLVRGDALIELLRMDLELNAQGLGVWLDRQQLVSTG